MFKIETDATGHPVAFVRVRSGRLASRDDVERHHRERDGTVVAVVRTRAAGGDLRGRCYHDAETLPSRATSLG